MKLFLTIFVVVVPSRDQYFCVLADGDEELEDLVGRNWRTEDSQTSFEEVWNLWASVLGFTCMTQCGRGGTSFWVGTACSGKDLGGGAAAVRRCGVQRGRDTRVYMGSGVSSNRSTISQVSQIVEEIVKQLVQEIFLQTHHIDTVVDVFVEVQRHEFENETV